MNFDVTHSIALPILKNFHDHIDRAIQIIIPEADTNSIRFIRGVLIDEALTSLAALEAELDKLRCANPKNEAKPTDAGPGDDPSEIFDRGPETARDEEEAAYEDAINSDDRSDGLCDQEHKASAKTLPGLILGLVTTFAMMSDPKNAKNIKVPPLFQSILDEDPEMCSAFERMRARQDELAVAEG